MNDEERKALAECLATNHQSVMVERERFSAAIRSCDLTRETIQFRALVNDILSDYAALTSMIRLSMVQIGLDIRLFVEWGELKFKPGYIKEEENTDGLARTEG